MSPFEKWWNESEHSEQMDCIDPRQVAKDAWDAALTLASELKRDNCNDKT